MSAGRSSTTGRTGLSWFGGGARPWEAVDLEVRARRWRGWSARSPHGVEDGAREPRLALDRLGDHAAEEVPAGCRGTGLPVGARKVSGTEEVIVEVLADRGGRRSERTPWVARLVRGADAGEHQDVGPRPDDARREDDASRGPQRSALAAPLLDQLDADGALAFSNTTRATTAPLSTAEVRAGACWPGGRTPRRCCSAGGRTLLIWCMLDPELGGAAVVVEHGDVPHVSAIARTRRPPTPGRDPSSA